MGIIPDKYISEQMKALGLKLKGSEKPLNGWLAVSPLLVFLAVYLVSSILGQGFDTIPVSSAFLIASIYAMCISRGRSLEERITIFTQGAGTRCT